jgi:hypothetical protein
MVAIVQIRRPSAGQAYYQRKLAGTVAFAVSGAARLPA